MNSSYRNRNKPHQYVSHTIKDLPESERPYEKCLESGAETLSDAELLSVILRTGSKGTSALELSRSLLEFGSDQGLLSIYHRSIDELMQIRGLGKVKAVQLKCIAELSKRIVRTSFSDRFCFKNPADVAEYYMEEMRHLDQEVMILSMLNSKGQFLCDQIISKGTVRSTMISPREIYLEALKHQAVSIILLHNHPSGNPEPSKEDIELTLRVKEAGKMLGIELLDHIIIGDLRAVSLREHGLWQEDDLT